jgi:hypothetical protein
LIFLLTAHLEFHILQVRQIFGDFVHLEFHILQVRQIFGDFAVFISICCMVLLDALLGVKTPKLNVPATIQVINASIYSTNNNMFF